MTKAPGPRGGSPSRCVLVTRRLENGRSLLFCHTGPAAGAAGLGSCTLLPAAAFCTLPPAAHPRRTFKRSLRPAGGAQPSQPCASAPNPRTPHRPLPRARPQDYIRRRCEQFVDGLSARIAALQLGASPDLLKRAAGEALRLLPPPDYQSVPVESINLRLVFRHDCV